MEQVETCDLCGSSLASAARVPGLEELGLVECRECGLVITTPRPSREEIGTFYPDTYYAHVPGEPRGWQRVAGKVKAYRGGYPTTDGAVARALWATAARVLRGVFLTQLPYRGGGRRLLDVGCGVGDALRWAVDHGWEGYGVEPDPEAVAIARARGLTRVAVGELRDQRYPDAFFDAITLYQALEHMHSPSRELAECRRILAPGGALYVSVPNFDSFPRRLLGERWYALQLPIHLYHFTPRTLSSLAGKAGFRVARRRDYSRLVSTLTTLKSLRSAAGAPPRPVRTRPLWRTPRGVGGMSDILLLELEPTDPGLPPPGQRR